MKIDFKVWDSKKNIWTNFMIIDNMFCGMDKFTGVRIRDDEQNRFKLVQGDYEVEVANEERTYDETKVFAKIGKDTVNGEIIDKYKVIKSYQI